MNYEQTSCKLPRNWVILGLNDMKAVVEDLIILQKCPNSSFEKEST